MFKKLVFSTLLFVIVATATNAQKTIALTDPVALYNRGLALFDKEKYGSAIAEFEEFITKTDDAELRTNAQYYIAVISWFSERTQNVQHVSAPETRTCILNYGARLHSKSLQST